MRRRAWIRRALSFFWVRGDRDLHLSFRSLYLGLGCDIELDVYALVVVSFPFFTRSRDGGHAPHFPGQRSCRGSRHDLIEAPIASL